MEDIHPTISPRSGDILTQLRLHICQSALAYPTEQTYSHWVKCFIRFRERNYPTHRCKTNVEAGEQRTCSSLSFRVDSVNRKVELEYGQINTHYGLS
jgi:hypothetical protein